MKRWIKVLHSVLAVWLTVSLILHFIVRPVMAWRSTRMLVKAWITCPYMREELVVDAQRMLDAESFADFMEVIE